MPFYTWPSYLNLSIGVVTGLISVATFLFAWRRRHIQGAINLIFLAAAGGFWSATYVMEIISYSNSAKEVWENFQYIAISVFPIIYFGFVRLYSVWKENIKRNTCILFFVPTLLTQIVAWTNPLHHWIRVKSYTDTLGLDFPGIHVNQYGWWFWLLAIYTLTFLAIDLILMMVTYFKTPFWARGKLIYVTIGMVLPWLTGIITFPQLIQSAKDYYFLIAIAISMLFIALGLLRVQMLDLLPIARKTLLDQMNDAVIVLDADGRIVEFNQSARKYFEDYSLEWIGQPLTAVLPQLPNLNFETQPTAREDIEVSIGKDDQTSVFEVRVSNLLDENKLPAGRLVTFHDITRRKMEAERLIKAEAQTNLALNHAQRHAEELSLLRRMNEQLNQATSLRQALIPTFKSMLDISHGSHIWALLLENDNQNHRLVEFFPNKPDAPLAFFEAKSNNVECIQDLLAGNLAKPKIYPSCTCAESIEGDDEKSNVHISFPLKSGVGPLGVININLGKINKIEDESIHLIETICDSLSVSIERVRLFKSEYDQRQIAETMQEIGVTLTASLDLNEVLDLLLEQIAKLVPYDAGSVMFLDEEKAWLLRTKGYEFLGKIALESLMQLTFPIQETGNIRNIVSTKKAAYVSDVHIDPNWQTTLVTPYFHSWIGAPVIINDKVVAIFSLDKKESGFYNQIHADRLTALSSIAALAIQNSRLFEAGSKRIRELEILHKTLTDITAELDIKKLLYDITERAVTILGATGGILSLSDKKSDKMQVIIGINNGKELVGSEIPIDKALLQRIAVTKKPFAIQEYSDWEERVENVARVFPHALITVPLGGGEEPLGLIMIGDSNPLRTFNNEDNRLISLFAQQATIALSNARLFADAKKRAEEAETMRRASAIVASSLEQKQALRLILEQLALVVPCDSASILLTKDDELEIVDGRGFKENKPVIGLRIPMGDDQPGSIVFKEKKSIIVKDMDSEFPSFNNIVGMPIKSWIGVPLIFKKNMIGILAIDSFSKNSYTKDHARLAQAFADQVAIALENVRLYEDAVKSAQRLAGLYKMSQRINANLKPEEVYRAIHKATIELMAPDSFILSMYDEETQMINDVYFVDHGIPQKNSSRPLGEGLFSKVVKEKKTLMFNNFNLNMLKKTKAVLVGDEKDPTMVRSLIIVPLKLGKKIKGVLSAQSYRADAFSEEDKETLELLAAHAVIALDNAQLFSEIQELAITDPLTRIFNRRQFFELAEQEYDRSKRYSRPFSILMFDIDLFKKVNDSYGHAVGDMVLQQIADICKHSLRDVDIFARYGGEEFVILLPETTVTEAQLMAERLRQLIARTQMEITSIKVNITLSFGVVEVDDTCRDIEDLLDRSDQALYYSKRTGRNRVSMWTPEMRLRDDTTMAENIVKE